MNSSLHPMLITRMWHRRAGVLAGAIAIVITMGASARSHSPAQAQPGASAIGTWRGTSRCLVRPSACNDEVVVFRIAPAKGTDSLALDGRKIVNGAEVEMGVLTCGLTPPDGHLACPLPQGLWSFRVQGDSLIGEVRLADGTRYRDVRTRRDAPR